MEAIIVIIILAGGGYAMYLFSRFGIEMLKDLFTTDDASRVRSIVGLILFFLFWFWLLGGE
jgi:hypothetical protein|tara:strand:- start:734 stop:916 length:183 start_codon:yes stop_codon:yes gene_type:complete